MNKVARLLSEVNLPVTFAELGQHEPFTKKQIDTMVETTLSAVYAKNMVIPLNYERLVNGLAQADNIGSCLNNTTSVTR